MKSDFNLSATRRLSAALMLESFNCAAQKLISFERKFFLSELLTSKVRSASTLRLISSSLDEQKYLLENNKKSLFHLMFDISNICFFYFSWKVDIFRYKIKSLLVKRNSFFPLKLVSQHLLDFLKWAGLALLKRLLRPIT